MGAMCDVRGRMPRRTSLGPWVRVFPLGELRFRQLLEVGESLAENYFCQAVFTDPSRPPFIFPSRWSGGRAMEWPIAAFRRRSLPIALLALVLLIPSWRAYAGQAEAYQACERQAAEIMKNPDTNVIVDDCVLDHLTEYFLGYRGYSPLWGWVDEGYQFQFPLPQPGNALAEDNRGPQCANGGHCPPFGDPINPATGNKYEVKHEFVGKGPFPIDFYWTYNSNGSGLTTTSQAHVLGVNRVHSYARALSIVSVDGVTEAYATRADGNVEIFQLSGTAWVGKQSNPAQLTSILDSAGAIAGYKRTAANGEIELYGSDGKLQAITNAQGFNQQLSYDSNGLLQSVVDPLGRALVFVYNNAGQLIQLGLPDGNAVVLSYDTSNHWLANLVSVSYPGARRLPTDTTKQVSLAQILPMP